jgi:hypothetical protein
VVLSARAREGGGYNEIHEFCKDLMLCSRGHAVYHNNDWYHVYCFSDPADAEKFNQRFGGEKVNPAQRAMAKAGRVGIGSE